MGTPIVIKEIQWSEQQVTPQQLPAPEQEAETSKTTMDRKSRSRTRVPS